MKNQFQRLIALIAVFSLASMLVALSPAQALPPGTPANGPVTFSGTSGTAATPLNLTPTPSPANCPGDSATGGYRWHGFLVPLATDVATLVFDANGPVGGGFPLLDTNGNPIVQRNTAITTGQIVGIPAINFAAVEGFVTAGEYKIGFACTSPTGGNVSEAYWSSLITISYSGAALSWTEGGAPTTVPVAPTLTNVTPGNGTLTAVFTPGASTPPATGYTVTATPQGGGAAVTATGAGSPITVTGLTNGTVYTVTVLGTNPVGNSIPSNSISATPAAPAVAGQPQVATLTATPAGAGEILVSWAPPSNAGTLAPTGYTLTVTPAVLGSPFTLSSATTSQLITGLSAGVSHSFEVVATYPAPDFGTPRTVQAASQAAQVLLQVITVERPAGALILTQRCGVNGALAAEPAVDAFPGFPAALAAALASSDQIGTSPDIDLVTPGVQADPEFGNYPFADPATYPTQCGVDLGVAAFVQTGALAGQYYAADGTMDEVTVVDTRDGDTGWTVQGTMSDFSSAGASFDGDYLGWTPVVTSDTAASPTYDQTVTAGPLVLPGAGVSSGAGLGSGQALASAIAGKGKGVAVLDARLRLLIPAEVPSGSYSGILSLTVI